MYCVGILFLVTASGLTGQFTSCGVSFMQPTLHFKDKILCEGRGSINQQQLKG